MVGPAHLLVHRRRLPCVRQGVVGSAAVRKARRQPHITYKQLKGATAQGFGSRNESEPREKASDVPQSELEIWQRWLRVKMPSWPVPLLDFETRKFRSSAREASYRNGSQDNSNSQSPRRYLRRFTRSCANQNIPNSFRTDERYRVRLERRDLKNLRSAERQRRPYNLLLPIQKRPHPVRPLHARSDLLRVTSSSVLNSSPELQKTSPQG